MCLLAICGWNQCYLLLSVFLLLLLSLIVVAIIVVVLLLLLLLFPLFLLLLGKPREVLGGPLEGAERAPRRSWKGL